MTRHYLLVTLALLVIIGGLTYWFFETFELREEEIPTGYEGEARSNPFYAARLFLREMGIDAARIDMPELNRELPPDTATLIITTLRGSLNEKKSQRLLDWVDNGGHLIIRSTEAEYYDPDEAEPPLPPKDPLLDQLGIVPVYNHNSDWDEEEDFKSLDFIASNGKSRELLVEFNMEYLLGGKKQNDLSLAGVYGSHVIHRKIGKGAVSVMSEMDFMQNFSLGEDDHAEAFWEIVNWHNFYGDKVFILHNDDMPPLLELFWNNLRPVVITLGLLLFFWLVKGIFRFGPLLPQPQARRRSLMEHIEASGSFFWQDDQQQRLIQQTRLALQKKLIRIHPGWSDLNEQEREQHLAELIQMPVTSVHQLLHGNESFQTQDFTRLIQQLETIRKQL